MKTIDISKFAKTNGNPGCRNVLFYTDESHGKGVNITTALDEVVAEGKVNLVASRKGKHNHIRAPFIRGLFSQAVSKVGVDNFRNRVSIDGRPLSKEWEESWTIEGQFWTATQEWLKTAEKRHAREAKAREREAKPIDWSPPSTFFVPDIGTIVKLARDWKFRLYREHRNDQMLKLLGLATTWDDVPPRDVTIEPGAEIIVDRVYIRKGVGDYSSLTFFLRPGARVCLLDKNGMCIQAEKTTKNIRFWAKLKDVNSMYVYVDRGSLSEV